MTEASATTVLAFDYGKRRIGVAVGQTLTGTATPLLTLDAADPALDATLAGLLADWRPATVLVGMPDDSGPTSIRDDIVAFAGTLTDAGADVQYVDESFSSREAESRLKARRQAGARRARRGDIDAEAARIIAEQWLQRDA